MTIAQRAAGPLLVGLCGACIVFQVLVRPAVGIANNGDFPKMAEPLGLGPETGDWESYPQYGGFLYHYLKSDRYTYNQGFRTAEFLSSQYFLVKLARKAQKVFQPGPRFDIRWLGGTTGAFFLLAIGLWIYAIPARSRLYLGLPVILIWSDVAYMQYLNSFYMDTAAMIFLILAAAAGLHAVVRRNDWRAALVTVGAAVLFATSKSQHAVPAFLFVPLFLGFVFWTRDRAARAVWIGGSVLLVIGACVVLGRDTGQRRATPVYTMVFWRLAPQAPDPLRALEELGLGRDELRLLGTHAYSANAPIGDEEWARRFRLRCNYVTLLRYYVHHPAVAVRFLYEDLSVSASRPQPFGNRSHDDGFPWFTHARSFDWWSGLRSFLFRAAPWHAILLGLAAFACTLWLLYHSPADRAFAALTLTMEALAALEYGIAVLGDAAETDRHLLIFHVATEISILLAPWVAAKIYAQRREAKRRAQRATAVESLAR